MTNPENNFSVMDGIEIQKNDLRKWKFVLRDDVFESLVRFATASNTFAKNGFEVSRGNALTEFIINLKSPY